MRNVLTAIVFFSLIAIILLVNTGCEGLVGYDLQGVQND